jgi:hypothetical protein
MRQPAADRVSDRMLKSVSSFTDAMGSLGLASAVLRRLEDAAAAGQITG